MTFNTNPYRLSTLEILQAMLHFSGRAFVDSNLGRRDYGGEPLTGASPTFSNLLRILPGYNEILGTSIT
jgi:hypothetical protein